MKNSTHFHLKIERINNSFFLFLNDEFIGFSDFKKFLESLLNKELFSFEVFFDSISIISGFLVFDDLDSFVNRINFLATGKIPRK